MQNETEVMVPTEELTDAELRENIQRLREAGETKHADQLQSFLDIGPIDERQEFWKWYIGGQPMLVAIQITPEDENGGDVWVSLERATEKHLIAAMCVETGHRRAIISMIYKLHRVFFRAENTTLKEAMEFRRESIAA